jgi:2-amino-4-hydroxy-6-hydroxymethyldihydropteridine diphosphokinase
MKYHIGLGSNIGEREENLAQAIELLKKNGVNILKKSSIYETSPVGNKEQPWFLNQVLEVQSDSDPKALLRLVLGIEKKMGRTRKTPKGPRCMDIDILLAEDEIVQSPDLSIPHPEMANRNFVLVPLKEIAYDTIHPVLKEKIGDLWLNSKDRSIVRPYVPAS